MGEEKVFTTKEFDLLTFLAGHPNRVSYQGRTYLIRSGIWNLRRYRNHMSHIKKHQGEDQVNTAKPSIYRDNMGC